MDTVHNLQVVQSEVGSYKNLSVSSKKNLMRTL